MASKIIKQKFYSNPSPSAPYFDVDISKINNLAEPLPYRTPPCFFLERELDRTARDLYATNHYRHCKVYAGKFLDYIAKKEFNSLEDWVTDCGSTMEHVLFGYNKFDKRHSYIRLSELIEIISPEQEVDIITKFMNKLAVDELSLTDILVDTHHGIQPFEVYMAE